MSGSAAIDVALGLGFVYLVFSLVCSGLNEMVATGLGWRARTLQEGLVGLLGDPGQVRRLFQHPLIRPLVRRRPARRWERGILRQVPVWERDSEAAGPADLERYPSYLPSRTVVSALVGYTSAPDGAVGAESHSGRRSRAADRIARGIAEIDGDELREALTVLWREAEGDADRFRLAAERWYDDTMERVSGWYRRKVQVWLTVWAVAIVVVINVDTIQIARTLWSDDALRMAVAAQADRAAARPAAGENGFQAVAEEVQSVEQLGLPLWWTTTDGSPRELPDSFTALLEKLAGLALTAVAVSMGAPFWFDALSKIARLRGTGAPPPATDAVRRGEGEERRVGPGETPPAGDSTLA